MSEAAERRAAAWELAFEIGSMSRDPKDLLAFGRRVEGDARITTPVLQLLLEHLQVTALPVSASEPRGAEVELLSTAAPASRPNNRTGRAGTHPDKSGRLVDWALQKVAEEGKPLRRDGRRGQSYRTEDGRAVHVRTMRRYDRGEGRYSYWFGISEELWRAEDLFVLVCDTDTIIVMPVADLLPYKALIAPAKNGTERQPNIWWVDGRFELRASGEQIDVSAWADRFDLL